MAGLIETELDNGNTVYGAGTTNYDATLRSVDAAKETVSGQLDRLLTEESTYINQARMRGEQTGQRRGLLNSTMAATAGESAAIGAALPIASADANTYTTASRDNQGFSNAAGQFNAAAKNTSDLNLSNAANTSQLSSQQNVQQQAQQRLQGEIQSGLITTQEQATSRLQELQGEIQRELSAQQAEQELARAQQAADIQTGQILPATTQAQKELADQAAAIATALQTLKGGQAEELAGIEANFKTLIQTSASASDVFKSAMNSISAIFADTTIPAAGKATVINGQLGWLKQQLNLIGSVNGVDLTGLTDFGTVSP